MAGLRDAYGNFKGPGNDQWKRSYNGIGPRTRNWALYEDSKEHFQCKDCGYYWPTEVGIEEWCGCCWNCWMRNVHPDELRRALRGPCDPPKKQETEEPSIRKQEKAQAKAIVQELKFRS